MERSERFWRTALLLASICVFSSVVSVGMAQESPPGQGNKRVKVDIDEDLTPLQSAIVEVVKERGNRGQKFPKLTLKCANPRSNNPRCQEEEPLPCEDCGELKNPAGKVIARRNRTETIIDYAEAGQRGKENGRFDRVRIGGRKSDGFGAGPDKSWKDQTIPGGRPELDAFSVRDIAASVGGQSEGPSAVRARVRRGQSGFGEAINNDGDCIDAVTGEWFPEAGCFDPETDSLFVNLVELPDGMGCEHVPSNQTIVQDPAAGSDGVCYDEFGTFKQTSLEELIDEDGPDFADNPIDQDGDGAFDEDPSESGDVVASCRAFHEAEGLEFNPVEDVVDGECDMSRALMVRLNKKAREAAEAQGEEVELAYRVDEQGRPVDEETARERRFRNAKDFGENPRTVTIEEELVIRCRGNEELIDGECVRRLPPSAASKFAAASMQSVTADASAFDRSENGAMLMGFTFAPPVVEWGYDIKEEVCADLLVGKVCVEVFFARIGYEFDIAAGLRLPVEVEIRQLPENNAPGARAETHPLLVTRLEPKDFSVGDFKRICSENNLSNDCERFAFPEFFDAFNPLTSGDAEDGSELVARSTLFAGVQVRVLRVPLINWAVDSDVDLLAMCSMIQLRAAAEGATLADIAKIGTGLATGDLSELMAQIKAANCASFTTPFGFDDSGKFRTFPFTAPIDVRADCAEALVRGEVINIGGKMYPICTGLVLGTNGASLGVGLGVEASLGSTRIDANWRVSRDAERFGPAGTDPGGGALVFRDARASDDPDQPEIELVADNFDARDFNDRARVELDDFVYRLNTVNLLLKASLQFGGILSPIPNIAEFEVFELQLDGDAVGIPGIPIPQHAGMDPIRAEFFVRNHALEVDGKTAADDEARVDEDTLLVKPGEVGTYQVRVTNRGSVPGSFDNFRAFPSNQPGQTEPFRFVINPNTDFDCEDAAGNPARGNPYDGIADNCYTADGEVRSDRVERIDEDPLGPEGKLAAERDEDSDGLADEDPLDVWEWRFVGTPAENPAIANVAPYQESSDFLTLEIIPFRHPLTAPGIYPMQIKADSVEAKAEGLAAVDPSGQARIDAEDVVFIKVDAFYDPLIVAQPLEETGKPGIGKAYTVEVTNGANVDDDITVATALIDFNLGACTLTTLGGSELCPFRATPTAVQIGWTNGELPSPTGMLTPLGMVSHPFTVDVPSDWAGMEDTTYQFRFTVTSTNDPEAPPASNDVLLEQTVEATMESMTRYIGLELDELILVLQQAQADGIATAGLEPISVQAVQRTNNRALDAILAGNLDRASRVHATNIRIVEGWVRALTGSGKNLPPELFDDLNARAAAILRDLVTARDNPIPSA